MQGYGDLANKFKPKLTTDDCCTPPLVYDAVLQRAKANIGIGEGRA